MKTIKQIVAVLCMAFMASTSFVSCGNNESVWDKLESDDAAIRKCLTKQDFQEAHNLLKSYDHGYSYYDRIQKEVYLEEIKYLVDQHDDVAWQKAFLLVQEYKAKSHNSDYDKYKDYEYRLELIKTFADYAVMFNHSETIERICKLLGNYINEMYALTTGLEDYELKHWEPIIALAKAIQKNCDCE